MIRKAVEWSGKFYDVIECNGIRGISGEFEYYG